MSEFPSTVEAVTIPHVYYPLLDYKTLTYFWFQVGGLEVIQKKTIPFPKVNPGDIVVKACIVSSFQ